MPKRTIEFGTYQVGYPEMKQKIEAIQSLEYKALACCLYGGMCRVSEIVGNKKQNKYGLRKQDIQVSLNTKRNVTMLRLTLWNEKQQRKYSSKVVVINKKRETWLCQPILDWQATCLTERLFPFSRVHVFTKIKELVGFNPHYFRKARATHFLTGQITGNPESVDMVKKLGGWTSAKTMMQAYSDFSTQDVENFV
jgi:integrase